MVLSDMLMLKIEEVLIRVLVYLLVTSWAVVLVMKLKVMMVKKFDYKLKGFELFLGCHYIG